MTEQSPVVNSLVLKIAEQKTVTVPVVCELFGDDDKVIKTLKLKVTFEKTGAKDWEREAEEADSSLEDSGRNIMLRRKVKDIKGLPLEREGQPVGFEASVMDQLLEHTWIAEALYGALVSVNAGKKSDTVRRALAKN